MVGLVDPLGVFFLLNILFLCDGMEVSESFYPPEVFLLLIILFLSGAMEVYVSESVYPPGVFFLFILFLSGCC